MASIFDFLTGNAGQTDPNNTTSSIDPTASYLGNLIDPTQTQAFADARRNQALLGLAVGLLGQGASRTPITFGQSLGAGLAGMQSAENATTDQALKAAQTSNAVSDAQYKKLQGALAVNQQLQLQNFAKTLQGVFGGGGASSTNPAASDVAGTTANSPSLTQGSLSNSTIHPATADALNMIAGPESGGNYFIGTGQKPGTQTLQNAQLDDSGFPIWEGTGNSHAAGRYQIQPGTWKDTVNKYFGGYLDWRNPSNQDAVAAKLYETQGWSPWAPYNPKLAAQIQSRQAMGLPGAPPSMGLPSATAPAAAQGAPAATGGASFPSLPGMPTSSYGGLPITPQQAQQLAIAAIAVPGLKLPDFFNNYAALPVDFAKQAQQKQLEIAGAGPITAAQEAARYPYGTQNVTWKDAQGNYHEGPVPNNVFAQMANTTFGGGAPGGGAPGGAPMSPPTPVAGSNFATNLPRLPGQPVPSAGQVSGAPQGAPAAPSTSSFDPNVWAARNKMPIGLVNGQLAPIDGRGNSVQNSPGWGVPNVTTPAPQGAPQSGGVAPAATPVPQGDPASPTPAMAPGGAGFTLGKPVLDPRAQFDPNGYDFSPKVGQGPGQTAPLTVPATTDHPYTTELPPLSSQGPLRMSGAVAGDVQKKWLDTTQKMADAQQGIQTSKQLLGTMADIFHRYEGGAFSQYQGEAAAKMQALGVPLPNGMNSPADMQQLMKDNFANAVAQMKATGLNRWTQMELAGAQKNFAGPDLQPAASFAIMSQDMGKILQSEALTRDWNIARMNGWSDPNSFASQWYSRPANDLQAFVGRAAVQFGGPDRSGFKGMSQQQVQQQIPQTGTAPNGARVMKLSNGQVVPL